MTEGAAAAESVASAVPKPMAVAAAAGKLRGWAWWKSMGSPKYVVAPMVAQSELAFRMLCRRFGAQLCYTPMVHSAVFLRNARYRREMMEVASEDRPLIYQVPHAHARLCGGGCGGMAA